MIKKNWYDSGEECIVIASLKSEQTSQDGQTVSRKWAIYLPVFKEGTMYRQMERDKNYTLEELGL